VYVQTAKRHASTWLIAQSLLTAQLGMHVLLAHAVHEMYAFRFLMPAQTLFGPHAYLLGVRDEEQLLRANALSFIIL
jgi:hypothetical protein